MGNAFQINDFWRDDRRSVQLVPCFGANFFRRMVEHIHIALVSCWNPSCIILQRRRWIGVPQLLADVQQRDGRRR